MKSLSRGPSPLVTLKVTPEMFKMLRTECQRLGVSRSAFVRDAIFQAIARNALRDGGA